MRALRILAVVAAIVAAGTVVFAALAWRSKIEPVAVATDGFDPALIEKGAQLAAVGNCIACHTVPGEKAFAGGLALPTPFGTIHSTNITPDKETGIGNWSEAARYKTLAAYLAVAVEVEVEPETGRVRVTRAVAAIDSG